MAKLRALWSTPLRAGYTVGFATYVVVAGPPWVLWALGNFHPSLWAGMAWGLVEVFVPPLAGAAALLRVARKARD